MMLSKSAVVNAPFVPRWMTTTSPSRFWFRKLLSSEMPPRR